MGDKKESEFRLLAWASAVLAAGAIIVTVLLPGTQVWLCRSGVRLACDRHDMKIDKIGFRHQWIPRSADGVSLRDALVSHAPPGQGAPTPIHCDEPEDPVLALQEANFRRSGGAAQLVRGQEDYVLADIALSYPSSEADMEIGLDITIRSPKTGDDVGSKIEPNFGIGNFPPGKQHLKVLSPANSGTCQVSFLLIPIAGFWGPNTAAWNAGRYVVDIDVRGGAEAHAQGQFDLIDLKNGLNESMAR